MSRFPRCMAGTKGGPQEIDDIGIGGRHGVNCASCSRQTRSGQANGCRQHQHAAGLVGAGLATHRGVGVLGRQRARVVRVPWMISFRS
jgi:hypothetical protein